MIISSVFFSTGFALAGSLFNYLYLYFWELNASHIAFVMIAWLVGVITAPVFS